MSLASRRPSRTIRANRSSAPAMLMGFSTSVSTRDSCLRVVELTWTRLHLDPASDIPVCVATWHPARQPLRAHRRPAATRRRVRLRRQSAAHDVRAYLVGSGPRFVRIRLPLRRTRRRDHGQPWGALRSRRPETPHGRDRSAGDRRLRRERESHISGRAARRARSNVRRRQPPHCAARRVDGVVRRQRQHDRTNGSGRERHDLRLRLGQPVARGRGPRQDDCLPLPRRRASQNARGHRGRTDHDEPISLLERTHRRGHGHGQPGRHAVHERSGRSVAPSPSDRFAVVPAPTSDPHSTFYRCDGLRERGGALSTGTARVRWMFSTTRKGQSTTLGDPRHGRVVSLPRRIRRTPIPILVRFGARWYAPVLGRWTSQDPLLTRMCRDDEDVLTSTSMQSSTYMHTLNNPGVVLGRRRNGRRGPERDVPSNPRRQDSRKALPGVSRGEVKTVAKQTVWDSFKALFIELEEGADQKGYGSEKGGSEGVSAAHTR